MRVVYDFGRMEDGMTKREFLTAGMVVLGGAAVARGQSGAKRKA
jgi:hypothetical protein